MSNKLMAVARQAKKYGQLGVLVPMSLPPYTYTMNFVDMLVDIGTDILFIPFMTPAVRMPWMMGGTEQIVDYQGYQQGITSEMNWEIISKVRAKYPEKPIVVVSFFNDILAYGVSRFAKKCEENEIDGLDTPGYSFVTNNDYIHYSRDLNEAGCGLIHPISTELAMAPEGTEEYDLLCKMLQAGRGFVFIMTDSAGKSGATGHMPVDRMRPATARIKEVQQKIGNVIPVITVCGVATAENAAEAVCQAGTDGVMLASAVIRKILADEPLEKIGAYLKNMKEAMKRG